MVNDEEVLTISEYASQAYRTDRFANSPDRLQNLKYGFFGEVGGLLSAIKKVGRDRLDVTEKQVAAEEIGDALWYLLNLSKSTSFDCDQLALDAIRDVRERLQESTPEQISPPTFRHVDSIIALHASEIASMRVGLLAELAQGAGELVAQRDQSQLRLAPMSLRELIAKLLCLLAVVSGGFGLKLEDVARNNLAKIIDRWPGENPEYIAPFDVQFDEYEQLPRVFEIEFIERDTGHVVQRMNKIFIGDRLTDNRATPDDYRFHDVFHLAYVAHLGWSPVLRGLLHLKRKSNPAIDENEDGARAAIIEEGIATWIFNHAATRSHYRDVDIGKLDYGLLKQVKNMVNGYEVASCPTWQWERAILDGFGVFRELIKPENRGGVVRVDMIKHTITFRKMPLVKEVGVTR
jgi:NTP pyrophosphatase (non-canonical NTP hydrolase)